MVGPACSDFLFLKRRGLETLIKTPLKGIKRLPERQMTLTKEPLNDLKGTMRNTPPALPLGSGVLPSQGGWWAILGELRGPGLKITLVLTQVLRGWVLGDV